jgi:hypothetical protein
MGRVSIGLARQPQDFPALSTVKGTRMGNVDRAFVGPGYRSIPPKR